jgi:multiple sugar transport system substrate-binding protein
MMRRSHGLWWALPFLVLTSMLWSGVARAQANQLKIVFMEYDPKASAYYTNLASDFEKANPGTKVDAEIIQWAQGRDRLVVWISGGQAPDLALVGTRWLYEFVDMKALEPLDRFASKEFLKDFYPEVLRGDNYQGHLYGLPVAVSTKALYYRTDLFEKAKLQPPKTWEELLQAAQKLNGPEVYGFGLPGSKHWQNLDNWTMFFYTAGGQYFDGAGKCTVNSAAGVKSLQFYADLALKYKVTQPGPVAHNRSDIQNMFAAGKLGMIWTGPWFFGILDRDKPGLKYAVARTPKGTVNSSQVMTDSMVMFNQSKNKDLAWKFLEFMYQDKRRLEFDKAMGMLPEKQTVAKDATFQNDKRWRQFLEELDGAVIFPSSGVWAKVSDVLVVAIQEVMVAGKAPQAALDEACRKIDEINGKQ